MHASILFHRPSQDPFPRQFSSDDSDNYLDQSQNLLLGANAGSFATPVDFDGDVQPDASSSPAPQDRPPDPLIGQSSMAESPMTVNMDVTAVTASVPISANEITSTPVGSYEVSSSNVVSFAT